MSSLLFLLRHHYPGRTWRVYLIDAPLVVRFLCSIVTLLFWVDTFGSAVEFVNVMRHKSLVSSYSDGLSEEGYIHENSSFLTPSKIPMNNFSLLPRIDTFSDEDDPLDGSSIVSSDTDTPTKGPSNDFQRKVIGGGKIAVPLLVHAERRQHSCSELKFDPNVCMSERIEI